MVDRSNLFQEEVMSTTKTLKLLVFNYLYFNTAQIKNLFLQHKLCLTIF